MEKQGGEVTSLLAIWFADTWGGAGSSDGNKRNAPSGWVFKVTLCVSLKKAGAARGEAGNSPC